MASMPVISMRQSLSVFKMRSAPCEIFLGLVGMTVGEAFDA